MEQDKEQIPKKFFVIISDSEAHPVPPGVLFDAPQGCDQAIYFFGLARKRGDNVVSSTKLHDNLFDVFARHGLSLYNGVIDNMDRERSNIMVRHGGNVHFVGMPYNIRNTLGASQYRELVREIANAIA